MEAGGPIVVEDGLEDKGVAHQNVFDVDQQIIGLETALKRGISLVLAVM